MKSGSVVVQIMVDGRPLEEHGVEWQGVQGECFVLPKSLCSQPFQVYIRDDTTNLLDTYDLRAEVKVTVDGHDVLRTRNCVLLRDVSEFEFGCITRRNQATVPFLFSGQDELLSSEIPMGRIEVSYRRFHKTYTASSPTTNKSSATRVSNLEQKGSTLAVYGESDVDLETVRLCFRYLTRGMLDNLTSVSYRFADPSLSEHIVEMHTTTTQRGDLYEVTSRDAFWRRSARL